MTMIRIERATVSRTTRCLVVALVLAFAAAACGFADTQGRTEGLHEPALQVVTPNGSDGHATHDLDGRAVAGTVTILVEEAEAYTEMHFSVQGAPDLTWVDDDAPFEFELDTAALDDGPHVGVASAPSVSSDGLVPVAEAAFSVANQAALAPHPPTDDTESDAPSSTTVTMDGDSWLINGSPTNAGSPAEGLLLNARMVQATFEDLNPDTVGNWSYPDGTPFDPERQTREFIDMIPVFAEHGLNAVTLSLQGGRPMGGRQAWINSAFDADGGVRDSYMARVARVIEALDDHGMVAVLSYFYFGQDQRLEDEGAIVRATEGATAWVVAQGYTNVLIEVVNEAGHRDYDHDVFSAERAHELVEVVQRVGGDAVMVSTSLGGGYMPPTRLVEVSDYHLLHGNNQSASRVASMVDELRATDAYGGEPIVFNEDSVDLDNMRAAVDAGASWGYYDQGVNDYKRGFQSPPTNWSINTPEKRAFFDLVRELTSPPTEP